MRSVVLRTLINTLLIMTLLKTLINATLYVGFIFTVTSKVKPVISYDIVSNVTHIKC
jgi:hypothetical protein